MSKIPTWCGIVFLILIEVCYVNILKYYLLITLSRIIIKKTFNLLIITVISLFVITVVIIVKRLKIILQYWTFCKRSIPT